MDAPAIRYGTTEDGVQVAFGELGTGLPLVDVSGLGFSYLLNGMRVPEAQEFYGRLSDAFRVLSYDARGFGYSARPADLIPSVETNQQDLAAVVDAAGLEAFGLFAHGGGAVTAIRYAACHPEAVRFLALVHPVVSGPEWFRRIPRTRHLIAEDWPGYCRAAVMKLGAPTPAATEAMGSVLEHAVSPALYASWLAVFDTADVTADLDRLPPEVLLIARRGCITPPLEITRRAAAQIPGARLVLLDGWASIPMWDNGVEIAQAVIAAFGAPGKSGEAGSLRTLLFTDLESSTAITQSLGDAKAQDVLHGHNDAVRTALAAHGGDEVKHTGDGIMAAFGSAVSAVEAALQIQRELADAEVRVRVGLNAGEPIHEDSDYFGSAVQLAARVCDWAEPGHVVATQVVRDLVRGKGFRFEEVGAVTLKGFSEPERLFTVAVREDA